MYDHMSFLIFLIIILIKPVFRISIYNYYTFRYLSYLEPIPLFIFIKQPELNWNSYFIFVEPVPEPIPINSIGSSP